MKQARIAKAIRNQGKQYGRGRGRGRGRGGRGGRGGYNNSNPGQRDKTINGVHVTHIWKQKFDDNDWPKVRDYINDERNKANGKTTSYQGYQGGGRTAKQLSSDREDESEEKDQEEKSDKGARNGSAFMKSGRQGRGTYKG